MEVVSDNNTCLFLDYLKNMINYVQMPLFFSISGYLFFYSTNKTLAFYSLFINKIKRLMLPFLFVGIFWLLPIRMIVEYRGYAGETIWNIIISKILLGTDSGHLWFLPTLFFIFLIMYFICGALKNINNDFANILVLVLLMVLSYFSYKLPTMLFISNIAKHMLWFYFGYIINQYYEKVKKRASTGLKVALVILMFLILVLAIFGTRKYLEIPVGLLVVLILYIVIPEKTIKGVQVIDRDSFGIYLFHSPLIYFTFSKIPNAHPMIVVIVNFCLLGAVVVGITEGLRKVRLGVVLGEK